jgi:hypothetical protein
MTTPGKGDALMSDKAVVRKTRIEREYMVAIGIGELGHDGRGRGI